MEYCEAGDLQQFLKKQNGKQLKEERVWRFFIEMCLGLNYLHSFKILHRDIKSMNIFLGKDNQVKIGDLGVARQLVQTNAMAETVVGTPYYLSPELCEEKPYNHKSDIWSLGCVLYELCTFHYPFEAMNRMALMVKILKGRPNAIMGYSEGLRKLSKELLNKDQRKRPSLPEIFRMESMKEKMKQLGYSLEDHLQQLSEHKAIAQGKPLPPPRTNRSADKPGTAQESSRDMNKPEEAATKQRKLNSNRGQAAVGLKAAEKRNNLLMQKNNNADPNI